MTRSLSVAVSCLLLVGLIVRGSDSQVLYTFQSPSPEAYASFGQSVSGAGDVNSDGYHDVVVAAQYEDGGASNAGRVYVFNGQTGSTLDTLESPSPEAHGHFGVSVSGAGDGNNDGCDDIVVGASSEDGGAGNAGRAYLLSGQTGGVLHTLQSPNPEVNGYFGTSVSGAGDVNNDGYDDVVVGAVYEDGGAGEAGRAYVFSGQTGGVLWTFQSPNPEYMGVFGRAVSGAGDVNNDGYDDVVVGAHYEDGGAASAGRAYIFSGQTGSPLDTLESPSPEMSGEFGCSVSGAGDVNNDGYDDVVVGAEGENGGAWDAGRAYIFSGQTGGVLHTLQSPNPESYSDFGRCVSGAGDANNDGYDDVVVGAVYEDGGVPQGGRAYIFSGQTGDVLCILQSANAESLGRFGWSVSGAGDVNGDGYDDVVLGAYEEDGGAPDAGRAYAYSPLMSLTGRLSGGALVLEWSVCPGTAAYWLYGADNLAYFEPELVMPYEYRLQVLPSTTTTWSGSNGVGDTDHNWIYLVIAVDASEQQMAMSNRFGEHDFSSPPGP